MRRVRNGAISALVTGLALLALAGPARADSAALATDVIIDNSDNYATRAFKSILGTWSIGTGLADKYGANYHYASSATGAATCRGRWFCTTLPEGWYEVYAWWAAAATRAVVPYDVKDGAALLGTVRVSQATGGGQWNSLGVYYFSAGGHVVEISNDHTGSGMTLCADAVRFVSASAVTTTELLPTTTLFGETTTTAATTSTTVAATSTTIEPTTTTLPTDDFAIIDNTDAAASKKFQVLRGTWATSSNLPDKYGADYRYAASSIGVETARARWLCTTLQAGDYDVYAWWSAYNTRTPNAAYVIVNGSSEITTVRANQTINGGRWNYLGTFSFSAGGHVVEISNNGTGSGLSVTADAVKFELSNGATTTEAPATTTTLSATTTTVAGPTTTTTLPVGDMVIDNADNYASRKFLVVLGTWSVGTGLADKYAADYRYVNSTSGAETARARWFCTTLGAGSYDVFAWWSAYSTRATDVLYAIKDGSALLGSARVDQTQNGGRWNYLGTFTFSTGGHVVEISNATGIAGRTITADAVRFVPSGGMQTSTTLPMATTTSLPGETTTSTTAEPTTTTTVPGMGSAVIDNADSYATRKFQVVLGVWSIGTGLTDKYGADYRYATSATGAQTARARWFCTTLGAGTYDVYAWWAAYSTRSSVVSYVIMDGSTELATVCVDQTANGGRWNYLGTYNFSAGGHAVEISNAYTGNGKNVCADAVCFMAPSSGDPNITTTLPPTTTTTLPPPVYVVDNTGNTNGGIFYVLYGGWEVGTALTTKYGDSYHIVRAQSDCGETARARWRYDSLPPGTYDVFAWWTEYENRSYNVPYVIKDGDTELATVRVNQSINGGRWNFLGTYTFTLGGPMVDIHNGDTYRPTPL